MDSRLVKARIVKTALIVILLAGGWLFYRVTLRPDPARLEVLAEAALREIFGPHVTHGRVSVDLLKGVFIDDLRVQAPGQAEPGLFADRVDIRHDVLALSAGVFRLRSVTIRGPRVTTREAPDGAILLDFPFDLPRAQGRPTPPPSVFVERGTLLLRASEGSERFRHGYVLELSDFHVTALPDEAGGLEIAGGFEFRGLGMTPETRVIAVTGSANAERGTISLVAAWPRLFLTPEVLDALSTALREKIDAQRLETGPHSLTVRIQRDPGVEAGRLRVVPEIKVTVRPDAIPARLAETVDARTREQLADLFGKIDLTVELSGNSIKISSLTSQLAGGEVHATGTVEDDFKTLDLLLDVRGLHLEDPAIKKALGPLGEQIFDEFRIAGRANAKIHLQRKAGGPFHWDAVVDLEDATAAYVGRVDPVLLTPSGRPLRQGFPYAAEHLSGRIRLSADSVVIEGLEGRHGVATVRVRGNAERARDGSETGYVRWGGGPTAMKLTVEAKNVPVDADLFDAVEGSELAGFLDTYRLGGVVDRVVLDIVREEPRDTVAVVELEIGLEGETFVYTPFPLAMTEVAGTITLRRPPIGTDRRGREFHISGAGRAGGGRVAVEADLVPSDRRGRVRVTGVDIALEGEATAAVMASEPGKGGLGEAWRFLHPFGRADVAADLPTYDDPAPESYVVSLRAAGVHLRPEGAGGGARIEGFAGPIRVTGGRVEIPEVVGSYQGAPVRLGGTLEGGPLGEWDLRVSTTAIPLTEGLLDVIMNASPCGEVFPDDLTIEPGGHVDLDLHLLRTNQPGDAGCVLTATVAAKDADMMVRLGELRVRLRGAFDVKGDDVHLVGVTAEGPGLVLSIPDAVLGPHGLRGTISARLTDLEMTKPVLGLLPEGARAVLADLTKDRRLDAIDLRVVVDPASTLTLEGALGLKARPDAPAGGPPRGRLHLAPLTLAPADASGRRAMSGLVRLDGVTIDAGVRIEEIDGEVAIDRLLLGEPSEGTGTLRVRAARIGGLTVHDLAGPVAWKDAILRATPLSAAIYGGRLDADVTVHTKAPSAFEGRATFSSLSLEDLLADLHARPGARGTLDARVEFQSRSGASRDLTAAGTASICGGDLGDLPVVATIPALLSSPLPDRRKPKFESAAASFTIEDERVRIDRITMAGPIFTMPGFGTLTFEGGVDITFAPQFIKSFLLPGSLQIPVVRDVLGLLREDPLYVIRVRGTLSDAKGELVPFPFLHRRREEPVFHASPLEAKPERRIPSLFR